MRKHAYLYYSQFPAGDAPHEDHRVEVLEEPRRIPGGLVVRIRQCPTPERSWTMEWDEPTVNLYNWFGRRPFPIV